VTATTHTVELVRIAAEAAAEKLANAIIGYDVSEQLVITDAFLLCSARNDRQVRSIVDEIEERLRRAGAKPVRREGEREGRWVLLDYVDFVVHVQQDEERVFYALERLWKDCPRIPLGEPVAAGVGGTGSVGRVGGADSGDGAGGAGDAVSSAAGTVVAGDADGADWPGERDGTSEVGEEH
jgi:ribosome-associated protein